MQSLYFVYFYENVLLYFSNVLYLHFFLRLMRRLHVNGESWDFILVDKALANPNYIPVSYGILTPMVY